MAITDTAGKTETTLSEINVTPFVDVLLVLLVIFMLTAPILQSGIELDVLRTRTVKEISQEKLVVSIDRGQRLYLGNDPVNIHMLGPLLKEKGATRRGEFVFLRADRDVPFGTLALVVDELRQAGIGQISMVTEPLEQRKSEPRP